MFSVKSKNNINDISEVDMCILLGIQYFRCFMTTAFQHVIANTNLFFTTHSLAKRYLKAGQRSLSVT